MKKPEYFENLDNETKKVYEHDMEEMWDPKISPCIFYATQKRIKVISSLIRKYATQDSLILDIGSAQATIPLILAEMGYKFVVNDIRPNFLKYAKMRYEKGDLMFVAGNFEKIEFKKRFKIITAFEIIEHMPDPFKFLKKIYNCLEIGGYLIITTPNGSFVRNKLPSYSSIKNKTIDLNFIYSADGDKHFFAFKPSELIGILSRIGFRVVDVKFLNSFLILGHMKCRKICEALNKKFIDLVDSLIVKNSIFKEIFSENILVIARR